MTRPEQWSATATGWHDCHDDDEVRASASEAKRTRLKETTEMEKLKVAFKVMVPWNEKSGP